LSLGGGSFQVLNRLNISYCLPQGTYVGQIPVHYHLVNLGTCGNHIRRKVKPFQHSYFFLGSKYPPLDFRMSYPTFPGKPQRLTQGTGYACQMAPRTPYTSNTLGR